MFKAAHRRAPSWLLLRIWAMAWMLALPLVHVHPDRPVHQDRADTGHSGTVHTVFSPDLEGEFTPHPHAADHSHIPASATSHQMQASAQTADLALHTDVLTEAAELAFAVLHDSTDRTELKPHGAQPLLIEPTLSHHHVSLVASGAEQRPTPVEQRLVTETPVRAPPIHSI